MDDARKGRHAWTLIAAHQRGKFPERKGPRPLCGELGWSLNLKQTYPRSNGTEIVDGCRIIYNYSHKRMWNSYENTRSDACRVLYSNSDCS